MAIINVTDDELPIVCESESTQIKRGDFFIRRGTITDKINYEELQMLLERKIEALKARIKDEELSEQLKQLKTLYDAIPTYVNQFSYSGIMQSSFTMQMLGKVKNKTYPEKTYEEFLAEMIKKKQEKIRNYL